MLADAFGQAALQHFQRSPLFVIAVASRDPVVRLRGFCTGLLLYSSTIYPLFIAP